MSKNSVVCSISLFSVPYLQAYAHVGEDGEEAEEQLVLSRYVKGNMDLSADPESEQWRQSTENIVESEWQHEVQVMSLNNGTHIFFLLSWDDATKVPQDSIGVADGAAILFETTQSSEDNSMEQEASAEEPEQHSENDKGSIVESEGEEKQEIWYWSTDQPTGEILNSQSVLTKAEWDHDHWNVLMGRQIQTTETM